MLAGEHITTVDSSVPTQQAHKLMNDLTTFLCSRLSRLQSECGLPWTVKETQQTCSFFDGSRLLVEVPFGGVYADVVLFAMVKRRDAVGRGIDLDALAKEHGVIIATTPEHLHDSFDVVLRSRIHACTISDESLEKVFVDLLRCCKALEEALYGKGVWSLSIKGLRLRDMKTGARA